MTRNESILLMTVLLYPKTGDFKGAMNLAEAIYCRVTSEPPFFHENAALAVSVAHMVAASDPSKVSDHIQNAKDLYAYILLRDRELSRELTDNLLRSVSAKTPAVSQPDGYSGEGGISD